MERDREKRREKEGDLQVVQRERDADVAVVARELRLARAHVAEHAAAARRPRYARQDQLQALEPPATADHVIAFLTLHYLLTLKLQLT